MAKFQRKKRKGLEVIYNWPAIVLLSVAVLFLAWRVFGLMNTHAETVKNKQTVELQIEQLKQDQARLNGDLKRLASPAGIEASIRDKFNVVKEGEGLIMVVDAPADEEVVIEPRSWFERQITKIEHLFAKTKSVPIKE